MASNTNTTMSNGLNGNARQYNTFSLEHNTNNNNGPSSNQQQQQQQQQQQEDDEQAHLLEEGGEPLSSSPPPIHHDRISTEDNVPEVSQLLSTSFPTLSKQLSFAQHQQQQQQHHSNSLRSRESLSHSGRQGSISESRTHGEEDDEATTMTTTTASSKSLWGCCGLRRHHTRDDDNEPGTRLSCGFVIYPWSRGYQLWWYCTVAAAVLTIFWETYQIAFYDRKLGSTCFEVVLTSIFVVDMFLKFHVAYHDETDEHMEQNLSRIGTHYLHSNYFWIDLVAVVPWEFLILQCLWLIQFQDTDDNGHLEEDPLSSAATTTSTRAYVISVVRLLRLLRTYRISDCLDQLAVDTRISLMSLTLIRNFCVGLLWTHMAACILYFMQQVLNHNANGFDSGGATFLGADIWKDDGQEQKHLSAFDKYVMTLYWSMVTFSTVGYGDFVPTQTAEYLFAVLYILTSIVIQAWIIGSITLLLIKKDEQTGMYRDTLETLDQYSQIHAFDQQFHARLRQQLQLDFTTREIADESVLKHFPSSIRRNVLRRLYMPYLSRTDLMKGVRPQFVDAFLSTSRVEIFGPGEEILRRNAISSDLYLLVGGSVELTTLIASVSSNATNQAQQSSGPPTLPSFSIEEEEVGETGTPKTDESQRRSTGATGPTSTTTTTTTTTTQKKAGDFINEIGFFTESPQIDTVRTVTVCKTLTMSRSAYTLLAQDHPGSAGKILQNLLSKVEARIRTEQQGVMDAAEEAAAVESARVLLPQSLTRMKVGSTVFRPMNSGDSLPSTPIRPKPRRDVASQQSASGMLSVVQDLVKMHISKQKDDHTTRFLFAASRDDVATISVMCDQGGFDPNNSDYDSRTALMVSAMKGNLESVTKLLEYGADPNLADMHGSTALYEAARNGHEEVMKILLKHGGRLCMSENLAASILDQAVFDGDTTLLKRLLSAQIPVNASDYDNRAPVHLAAAEGNLAALKTMVDFGADLSVTDRWGNTVRGEAERAKAGQILEYLDLLQQEKEHML